MRKTINLNIFCCTVLMLALGVVACKKTGSDDTTPAAASFDRKAMFTNIGNNVITPSYVSLQTGCKSMDSAIVAFNAMPNTANLELAQTALKNAYKKWEACELYGFGPALDEYLAQSMNSFPVDMSQLSSNINSGSYNFDAIINYYAEGFPAMDYLLFGVGTDNTAIITKYTTDADAAKRKKYLADLSAFIKTKVNKVTTAWTSGYANTFANATGTDISGSLGLMVNQIDFDMDFMKNYKLAIPMGKQTMGTLLPDAVEAYNSGISQDLIILQLKAVENTYLGRYGNVDGIGLDDYLVALNAQKNGASLNDAIKTQFTVAITKLQAIQGPLSTAITNHQPAVDAAYTEVQKLLVLLKSDMTSKLAVLITYNDNDGD